MVLSNVTPSGFFRYGIHFIYNNISPLGFNEMDMRIYYQSPIAPIEIRGTATYITHIHFIDKIDVRRDETPDWEVGQEAKKQLDEYFVGKRKDFHLPLQPEGTPFQQAVWQALQTIPYGETHSYGQIAAQINSPRASRAVGQANNRNPIAIVVPCHRVVGSSGKLTGYAGGLDKKEFLLALEATPKPR